MLTAYIAIESVRQLKCRACYYAEECGYLSFCGCHVRNKAKNWFTGVASVSSFLLLFNLFSLLNYICYHPFLSCNVVCINLTSLYKQ